MGLTDSAITARLRHGHWQRLHLGVYATFSGDPGRLAWLWAAVLRAGPTAVLSHHTAAELHGLTVQPAPVIHVTVRSGNRVAAIDGVSLHYSQRAPEARHPVLLPPRTRIEETVLDLAAASSLDSALSWTLRACGSRRTTPDKISAAMLVRSRVRWRSELSEVLGLAADGVHSLLEYRYVNQVEAAHPESLRWTDIRRDNANAAAGQVTLRYGWADVTQRPCHVAAEVGGALARRGWAGAPRRCGRTCKLPQ